MYMYVVVDQIVTLSSKYKWLDCNFIRAIETLFPIVIHSATIKLHWNIDSNSDSQKPQYNYICGWKPFTISMPLYVVSYINKRHSWDSTHLIYIIEGLGYS